MNTSNIKAYAPRARNEFMAAMRKQAAKYGIGPDRILPAEQKGNVLLIGDTVFPLLVKEPREKLIKRIEASSFEQTIDYIAYSWFNRLCAIRYMECKGLLGHGRRVLSSADGSAGLPQILEECLDIDLPGLSASRIAELKLDGNKDEELYRELLLAQCHALHQVMPLLFEEVSDESELLLPDNLTKTDSLIRDLVSSIPEEDWSDVQIIGWLYQFYISEKKDQVIGKVVKSEDIPAATQLFTPNWIVKYLVQNSIGRLWLMANPESILASEWEYYIQPAQQTDEVNAQLKQLIEVRIREDGDTLNPESITVLDPACGSGHILVEAYDCLKAMYLERGYRSRDIPRLILENNLYGIDIDPRAAQLASFALLMKAREDDRRLFNYPPKLNILTLKSSLDLDADKIWQGLNLSKAWQKGSHIDLFDNEKNNLDKPDNDTRYALIKELKEKFKDAKTFGSLIRMDSQAQDFVDMQNTLEDLILNGDTQQKIAAKKLLVFIIQAKLLAGQYDTVIANPPYMGSKGMNANLKYFGQENFNNTCTNLYSMFIERGIFWLKESGCVSMISMDSWLYGDEFTEMRQEIIDEHTVINALHLGAHAFPEITGEVVQTVAFTLDKKEIYGFNSIYFRLVDQKKSEEKEASFLRCEYKYISSQYKYTNIPRKIFAYFATDYEIEALQKGMPLKNISEAFTGLQTGDNPRFIRSWNEVSYSEIGFGFESRDDAKNSDLRWFPYVKGSDFRKWYGNNTLVVNWKNDGLEIRENVDENGKQRSRPQNTEYYFRKGIAYNTIAANFSARYIDSGYIFDQKNSMFFSLKEENVNFTLGLINSVVIKPFLDILSPKDFGPGSMKLIPVLGITSFVESQNKKIDDLVLESKKNWDSYETSWDFTENPLIRTQQLNLEQAFNTWQQQNSDAVAEMKRLEEENNRLFIDAYGLQDELKPDVPDEQITLTRADREKDSQRLVSYAIGCMMGRYSLDEPGLIYAHAGNQGFDTSRYRKFPADNDGIVLLTDTHWFENDAGQRIQEFLTVVWSKQTLEANMQWLAESLGRKASETADEAIRRYLAGKFYKDHLQTYKNRPIYWLFSSGKLGAFQALVYLHRYNESTLARMRTEYVMPLISKMAAYAKSLEVAKENSDSAAEIKRIEKKLQDLHKQQAELGTFEEKLRNYADQRIALDLDKGVKVNYGEFGDLLAEVKDVTGGKKE